MWIEAGLLFSGSSGFGRLRMPDLGAEIIIMIMMMIIHDNDTDCDDDDGDDDDE